MTEAANAVRQLGGRFASDPMLHVAVTEQTDDLLAEARIPIPVHVDVLIVRRQDVHGRISRQE